jgi:plasmid stabilization system protein ParE
MARVVWDSDAEKQLRRIAYYVGVERQSPQGACRVIDSIREKDMALPVGKK